MITPPFPLTLVRSLRPRDASATDAGLRSGITVTKVSSCNAAGRDVYVFTLPVQTLTVTLRLPRIPALPVVFDTPTGHPWPALRRWRSAEGVTP